MTAIGGAALSDIYMIGRRGPIEASFTSAELAELGRLENLRPVVAKADLPDNIPAGLDPAEARVKEKKDRKSVGEGKSVSVWVELGGSRCIKKNKIKESNTKYQR